MASFEVNKIQFIDSYEQFHLIRIFQFNFYSQHFTTLNLKTINHDKSKSHLMIHFSDIIVAVVVSVS